jgi:hypothetical protein
MNIEATPPRARLDDLRPGHEPERLDDVRLRERLDRFLIQHRHRCGDLRRQGVRRRRDHRYVLFERTDRQLDLHGGSTLSRYEHRGRDAPQEPSGRGLDEVPSIGDAGEPELTLPVADRAGDAPAVLDQLNGRAGHTRAQRIHDRARDLGCVGRRARESQGNEQQRQHTADVSRLHCQIALFTECAVVQMAAFIAFRGPALPCTSRVQADSRLLAAKTTAACQSGLPRAQHQPDGRRYPIRPPRFANPPRSV